MEPSYPNVDKLMEFLENATFTEENAVETDRGLVYVHTYTIPAPPKDFDETIQFTENEISVSEDDEYITISIPTDLTD